MNNAQLRKLGLPDGLIGEVLAGIRTAADAKELRGYRLKRFLPELLADPAAHAADPHFGALAQAVMTQTAEDLAPPPEPIAYRTWGDDIDAEAHKQMRDACSLPQAAGAALMPDAGTSATACPSAGCWRWRTPSCPTPWAWTSPAG